MKVDFIIIGQGLAGTLLANELIRLGKSVVVFDDPDQPKASGVAAGLINPVVFRRMTKSWMLDEVSPVMETTYRQLENLLHKSFYFPAPIYRIFDEKEVVSWKEKVRTNHLENYLEAEPEMNFRNKKLSVQHGTGLVKKAGRLEIQKLLSAFSAYLTEHKLLRKEKFRIEELLINSGTVTYDDIQAEKIIFCEGPAAAQNPYFSQLKFKPSKGEILELSIPELDLDEIISREIFVMPLGGNRYKVGATYRWDELNQQITESAREELLGKLKTIVQAEPEILHQKAGIRPTMHDRKPVIGVLPGFQQIGIFNGLGSKGVLLGPYFARQFAQYLTGDAETIHPEVSILRYFRKK